MVSLATLLPVASILPILLAVVGPVIVVTGFIGAYVAASKTFDAWLALALRLMEYVFKKLD